MSPLVTLVIPSTGMLSRSTREAKQSDDLALVGRVVAFDVEIGRCLREAKLLRLLEDLIELEPVIGHPGEDVVARPVEDAVHGMDSVRHQSLPQRFDNRDGARDGGLVAQIHAVVKGRLGQLGPVHRDEHLVCRHHVLTRLKRRESERFGGFLPADELADDLNARVRP